MKVSKYVIPTNIIRVLGENIGMIAHDLINNIVNNYGIKPYIIINKDSYDINIEKINKPVLNDIRNFSRGYLAANKTSYQFIDNI